MSRFITVYLFIIILLTACGVQQSPQIISTPSITPPPTLTSTPIPTSTITPTPTLTPTPTPLPMAGPIMENVMTRLGKGWVNDLTFSPNGKILSVATSIGVYLYQVETMELFSFLPSDAYVNDTVFIDDKTLVIGESDGSTIVWNIEGEPKALETLQRTDPVAALGVTEEKTILITEFGFSGSSGAVNVIVWDRTNPENVSTVSSEYGYSTEYSPSKNILLLTTNRGKIILVDMQRMRATAIICNQECYASALSQSGETLAAVKGWADKAQIVFFDITSQKEIAKFKNPDIGRTTSLAFFPDGKLLASASPNTLNLWNVETATLVDSFDGALTISFSPDGTLLASASQDGNLILRELSNGDTRFVVQGFTPINNAVFQNGYTASTMGYWKGDIVTLNSKIIDYYFTNSGTIFLRNILTGEIVGTFSPSEEDPFLGYDEISMAFTQDEKTIATTWSRPENTIVLFDVNTGEPLKSFGGFAPLAFSPDSSMLATGAAGNQLVIWDIASGQPLPLSLGLVPETSGMPYTRSLVFSPDSSMIAILSDTVVLRDLLTGKPIKTLESGLDPSLGFFGFSHGSVGAIGEFSPKGNILASTWLVATNDDRIKDSKGVIILWDVSSGEKIALLDGHSNPTSTELADLNPITALAFSPDGNLLASGAEDNTIILWDMQNRSLLKVLEGHTGAINNLSFSSDGKLLYSNALDGTVLIWNIEQFLK